MQSISEHNFFFSSMAHLNFKWNVAIIRTGDAAFSREAEQHVLRTVYTECKSEDGNTFEAWSNVCFKEYCHISHEAHIMKDMIVYVLYYWHCSKYIKEQLQLNDIPVLLYSANII